MAQMSLDAVAESRALLSVPVSVYCANSSNGDSMAASSMPLFIRSALPATDDLEYQQDAFADSG